MDDRRRTADDEHTVLDNAQDSGDRGKNKNFLIVLCAFVCLDGCVFMCRLIYSII